MWNGKSGGGRASKEGRASVVIVEVVSEWWCCRSLCHPDFRKSTTVALWPGSGGCPDADFHHITSVIQSNILRTKRKVRN